VNPSEVNPSEVLPSEVLTDDAELAQELARNDGADIEYWVPDGDTLIPATQEQAERFREYDRERAAQYRLRLWYQEEAERKRAAAPGVRGLVARVRQRLKVSLARLDEATRW
jgi:hypothetical protein